MGCVSAKPGNSKSLLSDSKSAGGNAKLQRQQQHEGRDSSLKLGWPDQNLKHENDANHVMDHLLNDRRGSDDFPEEDADECARIDSRSNDEFCSNSAKSRQTVNLNHLQQHHNTNNADHAQRSLSTAADDQMRQRPDDGSVPSESKIIRITLSSPDAKHAEQETDATSCEEDEGAQLIISRQNNNRGGSSKANASHPAAIPVSKRPLTDSLLNDQSASPPLHAVPSTSSNCSRTLTCDDRTQLVNGAAVEPKKNTRKLVANLFGGGKKAKKTASGSSESDACRENVGGRLATTNEGPNLSPSPQHNGGLFRRLTSGVSKISSEPPSNASGSGRTSSGAAGQTGGTAGGGNAAFGGCGFANSNGSMASSQNRKSNDELSAPLTPERLHKNFQERLVTSQLSRNNKLSESQQDFFRMLDEKIAQGRDLDSSTKVS